MKKPTLLSSPPMPETSRSSQVTPTCLCLIPAAAFASFDDVKYSRRSNVSWRSPSRPFSRSIEAESLGMTLSATFGVLSDCCSWPKSVSAWATTTWSCGPRSGQSVEVFDIGVSVMVGEGRREGKKEEWVVCCLHPVGGI